jgi:hypothetical protein
VYTNFHSAYTYYHVISWRGIMVKRILSIDGGGIRGVIPARILAELERRLAAKGKTKPLYKHFDMIAGTSTGGIIALGLTTPNAAGSAPVATAADLEKLYVEKGLEIFPQGVVQKARKLVSGVEWPTYAPEPLEKILNGLLGKRKLSEALSRVLVTAYEIEERRAVFLTGAAEGAPQGEPDYYAAQAARATSAAPTYFPPALITPMPPASTKAEDAELALVDGGMFANDPGLGAYTEAIKLQQAGLWDPTERIDIVSIGTGLSTRAIPYQKAKRWGAIDWISPGDDVPLVSILMHGQQSTTSYQLNTLLNPPAVKLSAGVRTVPAGAPDDQRYFRFNIKLDTKRVNDEMDDASATNIKALQSIADQIIKDQSAELDAIVARLS